MLRARKIDIADTNCALLGSELNHKVRQAAADGAKEWKNTGTKVGLEIWRIENFKVVPVDPRTYGQFHEGDSYIILHTYMKRNEETKSEVMAWDIHFWLGTESSQDEVGTAAYKTVELDDHLRGAAPQYREVEGHESKRFQDYFTNCGGIHLLAGGVASGFHHVDVNAYRARLLLLRPFPCMRVEEVPLDARALHTNFVFVLDAGLRFYQWQGKNAPEKDRARGDVVTRSLAGLRPGAKTNLVKEGEDTPQTNEFWAFFPGGVAAPIATAPPTDSNSELPNHTKIFELTDTSDAKSLQTKVVAEGKLDRAMLKSEGAYLVDIGKEVFVWIGKNATCNEKKRALTFAHMYLAENRRPTWTPIAKILEGAENSHFQEVFFPGQVTHPTPHHHWTAVQGAHGYH